MPVVVVQGIDITMVWPCMALCNLNTNQNKSKHGEIEQVGQIAFNRVHGGNFFIMVRSERKPLEGSYLWLSTKRIRSTQVSELGYSAAINVIGMNE